jgi:methionyl-tRNA synthetase
VHHTHALLTAQLVALVQEGVRDFSISRAAVSWGIPIPRDPEQTVYVWFDALIGKHACLCSGKRHI